MFRATVSAATVIKRYRIFGEVINRLGKIADFGHKYRVRDLGSGRNTPTKFLWEYPLRRGSPYLL